VVSNVSIIPSASALAEAENKAGKGVLFSCICISERLPRVDATFRSGMCLGRAMGFSATGHAAEMQVV
jgi:hypothetical protein